MFTSITTVLDIQFTESGLFNKQFFIGGLEVEEEKFWRVMSLLEEAANAIAEGEL